MEEETRQVFAWCVKNKSYEDALVCLCRLGQLRTDQLDNLKNEKIAVLKLLFDSLETSGSQERITSCLKTVFNLFPSCPYAIFEAACFLYKCQNLLLAIAWFEKALELKPDLIAAEVCLENAKSQAIDQWHFRMLNDKCRNEGFRRAITDELMETPSHSVLDIGTGTGILSIFAHCAGAKQIHACEVSDTMFKVCENILSANDLRHNISLFNKYSYDIRIPSEIPERVSLLVTEVFDAGLFGEGVLNTLKHAWDHLLRSPVDGNGKERSQLGGKVIPNSATVYVCLAQCEWLRKSYRLLRNSFGPLDLSNVTVQLEQTEPYDSEHLRRLPGGYKLLAEPVALCTVNFNDLHDIETLIEGRNFPQEMLCTESGIVDCVVMWFELDLGRGVSLSSAPETESCWEQAVFPILERLEARAQDSIRLEMRIEGHLKLENVTVQGHEMRNKKNIVLSSEWIRKLNCSELACCLQSSLQSAFDEGKRLVVDMETVPLAAVLALKMKSEKVLVISENTSETLLALCNLLNLPTDNLLFSTVEELSQKVTNDFNTLFFDPMELTGNFCTNVFENVACVKAIALTQDCLIFPQSVKLHGSCLDSPVFSKYKKLKPDKLLDDLKIGEHMNKFQTQFHQDIHSHLEPESVLSKPVQFSELTSRTLFTAEGVKFNLDILNPGTFNLFVFWAAMQYGGTNVLNSKCCDALYNLAGFMPLSELSLNANDKLEITFNICNSYPVFKIRKA